MSGGDLVGLVLGVAVIGCAVFSRWIPGLRRLHEVRMFPPFREWAARSHPDARVPVTVGRAGDRRPPPGHGLVVVHTGYRGHHPRERRLDLRVARPLTPVVYVDGYPASWGWGETRVALPPGPHLIAVGSSHSRCYQQVTVATDEVATVHYTSVLGARAHNHREAGREPYEGVTFGARSPRSSWHGWTAAIVLAAALVAVILASLAAAIDPGTLVAALAAAAVGAGVAIGLWVVVKAAISHRRDRHPHPVVVPPPATAAPVPLLRDQDRPEAFTPTPGWAGLGLWLRYEFTAYEPADLLALAGRRNGRLSLGQRWRVACLGEPEPPACRPWLPPPELRVDGVTVPATWTRSWLQLPPGEHEITVTVSAPGSQARALPGPTATTGSYRVTLRPGQTTELPITATVTAVPRPDRPELARFAVALR